MQTKKSHKANLERKRGIHFFTGILISLSLVLISFEWTSSVEVQTTIASAPVIAYEPDIIRIERQEEYKPKKMEKLPPVMTPIPVDENVPIEDWEWSTEVTDGTKIQWKFPEDRGEEILPPEPKIYYAVEDDPLFNGGDPKSEFMKYIAGQLDYPEEPARNGVSGRVTVQFDINPRGELVNIQIISGVHPDLDREAVRVLESSPRWTPGKQWGKAVTVRFTFPINFVLQ